MRRADMRRHQVLALACVALCAVLLGGVVRAEEDDEAEESKGELGDVIGIDLGTTYSCVGVYQNGRVEIIPNDQVRARRRRLLARGDALGAGALAAVRVVMRVAAQGNRITPSYVAWANGDRMVGDAAKNQATVNPTTTVRRARPRGPVDTWHSRTRRRARAPPRRCSM